jgi:prophage regulatory protein
LKFANSDSLLLVLAATGTVLLDSFTAREATLTMATDKKILFAVDLEEMSGIPQSTWRYWAHTGQGPRSYSLGRRRVWDREIVEAWLAEQRAAGQ